MKLLDVATISASPESASCIVELRFEFEERFTVTVENIALFSQDVILSTYSLHFEALLTLSTWEATPERRSEYP